MIPDIDKIIKAIKCRNGIDDTDSCTGCHYFVEEDNKLHHVYCNYQQLLNDVIDALELLKEQEEMKKPTLVWPVPPERFRNKTTDT